MSITTLHWCQIQTFTDVQIQFNHNLYTGLIIQTLSQSHLLPTHLPHTYLLTQYHLTWLPLKSKNTCPKVASRHSMDGDLSVSKYQLWSVTDVQYKCSLMSNTTLQWCRLQTFTDVQYMSSVMSTTNLYWCQLQTFTDVDNKPSVMSITTLTDALYNFITNLLHLP
jgi:hypothetical protein